jgi:hypothetical protein
MKSSVYIPQGLWHFVGRELIFSKYIDEASFNLINEEPVLRWLLIDEAGEYSQVDLFNFDATEVKKEKYENVDYLNLFVRETFRRKDIFNKMANTQEMIIVKGYIGFDNVILMNNQKVELEFKEAKKKCSSDNSASISVDCVKLALFIEALIEIYQFRVHEFKKKLNDDFSGKIMLNFLALHSIDPFDFKLDCLTKSDEGWNQEERIRENIVKAIDQESPTPIFDRYHNLIAEFDVGRLFRIEDGRIHVNFGAFGLKTKGNLVGLGHILYNPRFFGARDVLNVINSWNWLVKETKVNEEELQMAFESSSLAMLLVAGAEFGKDVFFFSLIVDLFELNSAGIDTKPKIEEFGHQIRSHLRKFGNLLDKEPWKAFIIADFLKDYLFNVSSECRLARKAKLYGFEIVFSKHPDLRINGKRVEVKNLRSHSLSNPIVKGLKQPHDIIAIEVETLEKRVIPNRKANWLGKDDLSKTLQTALSCGDENEKILLFMNTAEGWKGRILLLKR